MSDLLTGPPEPVGLDDGGVILPGTARGKHYGFAAELFSGYLWRNGHSVWVSLITSLQPGRGHVRALLDGIEAKGLQVVIPTVVSARLVDICDRRGMEYTVLESDGETIDAYVSRPEAMKEAV